MYLINFKKCDQVRGLRIHEGPGGTEQTLYCINEQIIRLSGPHYAISAHVVLQHVNEG